jgi:hypothetical protein
MRKLVLALVCGLALGGIAERAACAEVLITPDEAKLPSPPGGGASTRGLTRGPGIIQESPSPSQSVRSPMPFKIKFETRNNVAIDLTSVRLVYMKATPVDLTGRIRNHLTSRGIEMDQAETPPGVHLLRLDLKDLQGRVSSEVIKLNVAER